MKKWLVLVLEVEVDIDRKGLGGRTKFESAETRLGP